MACIWFQICTTISHLRDCYTGIFISVYIHLINSVYNILDVNKASLRYSLFVYMMFINVHYYFLEKYHFKVKNTNMINLILDYNLNTLKSKCMPFYKIIPLKYFLIQKKTLFHNTLKQLLNVRNF